MSKSKYIIVVGCGRLGALLAEHLSRQGHSVVAVDRDETVFERLSPDFTGFKLQGDASRVSVLRQAKIDKADIVVATTRNDNVNLMVVQVAKNLFNVPRVMARLYDTKREEMYADMDIEMICPVRVAAERFIELLDRGRIEVMPEMNKVMLAGSGKNLYFLALNFISKGYHVTLVDPDREECTHLARELKATVVHGDASYPQVLEDAGVFEMDAVLAMTGQDQDNLVICQTASLHFQVPRCMALVNDPENEEVFKRLGVTAISVAGILASLIDRQVSWDEITTLLPLGGGRVNILEMLLEKDFPICGKPLQQVALPHNSLIAVVMRDGETLVPRGGTILQAGDRIILISLPETLGETLDIISGGKR